MGVDLGVRSSLARRLDFYYGWVIALACFVGALVSFGTIYSFGVFFSHIVEEFSQSHANTSVIFALQSVVTFGGAAVLGFGIDRYGTRRLMFVGAALIGVGLLAVSRLTTFLGVVLAYGIVAAAGFSLVYVISFTTPTRWFGRRRGLATGIATSGSGTGILVLPPFATFLIERFGWRNAYVGLTAVFLVVLGFAALLIADRPSDLDVDAAAEFPDGDPDGEIAGGVRDQIGSVGRIAWTRPFVLTFASLAFAYVPTYILMVYLVEYAANAGIGRAVGVLAMSVIGAMNIAGKFLAGSISDRIGTVPTLAGCIALMGAATVLLAFLPFRFAVIGLAAVFGIGYGGSGALQTPMIADLFGTLNISSLFGLISVAFAITGSVVPYLVGFGFDAFGTFVPAMIAGGIVGLASTASLLAAGRMAGVDAPSRVPTSGA